MDVAQIISKFGEPSPGWWVIAILAVLSLIQISPIKINPWDAILGWLGRTSQIFREKLGSFASRSTACGFQRTVMPF